MGLWRDLLTSNVFLLTFGGILIYGGLFFIVFELLTVAQTLPFLIVGLAILIAGAWVDYCQLARETGNRV